MIDPPDSDAEPEAIDARRQALLGLYALTPRFEGSDPGLIPGFMPLSPKEALTSLAEAPEDEITVSARLDLLHELAKADFPHHEGNENEYLQLASSVALPNQLDPNQLLSDLKTAAGGVDFAATDSGRQLDHHIVAFIGQDVCKTATVEADGIPATWIFSEFETDAPFENIADWVDPRNWPQRGPMLFKRMDLVGSRSPTVIQPALGDDHWHSVFHEEVQLVKRVNTLLHCDFWRDSAGGPGRSAGMTYDLDISLDGEIDVDRGFLLVNDVGPVRRVKALKIVGFSDDMWDQVATWVCPIWTDFVRRAVEGGSSSTPRPPSHVPSGGSAPVGGDAFDAWVRFFGESARAYLELWDDVRGRTLADGYSASDWVDDGTRYWSQLAGDWAKAWRYGLELLDDVADQGLEASFMPPGAPAAGPGMATMMRGAAAGGQAAPTVEGTTIPVTGITPGMQLGCSDLASIEAGGVRIPKSRVSVSVEPLDGNAYGAHITTSDTAAPPGLYVGSLLDENGRRLAPVQLYLSRTTTVAGS